MVNSPPPITVSLLTLTASLVATGCTSDRMEAGATNDTMTLTQGMTTVGTESSGTDSTTATTGDEKFDVGGSASGGLPCEEGGNCPECEVPEHTPCDDNSDPHNAIGLNCPGDPTVTIDTSQPQHPGAIGVRTGFGGTAAFDPREGAKYAVLGSGFLADLDNETPDSDAGLLGHASPTHCNDDLGAEYDPPGGALPAPISTVDVGAMDCTENPALIGTGDCSNTIQGQFDQGGSAYDYTEVRFTATVPSTVNSFSYDFAFFSTEYPYYYNMQFNDMYVGWLNSEVWTGNISFDETGNPISLNAGFLDYRDDSGGLPEFAGTCMRYHAGTKWLSTTAGVAPGEQITVIFAVFDLADSILDSYVFLDNFQWGCDGDAPPSTKPVG